MKVKEKETIIFRHPEAEQSEPAPSRPNRHARRAQGAYERSRAHLEQAKEKVTILREPEVRRRTKLSRSTRWRMIRENKFPNQVQLGKRARGWIEAEVDEWLEKLKPCTVSAMDASASE